MKTVLSNIKKFIIVIIILLLIIIIGLTSGSKDDVNGAENVFGTIFSNVEKVVYNIGNIFKNAFNSIHNISKMNEENELLKENLYKLEEENRILKNIINTSDVLEAEYELRMNLKYNYVIGQVIARDDSNWFSRFSVDKGTKDGIKKNDIVIQAVEGEDGLVKVGLVGVVSEVGYNWSKITTIIDENCKVSFINVDNNESGIISGNVDGSITGFYLDNKAEADIGDEIFTSGIGDVYYKDIFIGEITDIVDTTDASSKKIFVEPAIDFTNIYKVFILKVDR